MGALRLLTWRGFIDFALKNIDLFYVFLHSILHTNALILGTFKRYLKENWAVLNHPV